MFPKNELHLVQQLADLFSALPQVEAVGMGGSQANEQTQIDSTSDIDLYVFTHSEIPMQVRWEIVEKTGGSSRAEMGLNYWGPNDTWHQLPSGVEIDNNFFETGGWKNRSTGCCCTMNPAWVTPHVSGTRSGR